MTHGEELAGAGQALIDKWVEERGVNGDWRDLAARIDTALRLARAEALEEAAEMIDPATSFMARGEVCDALRARATAVRAGKGEAK